MKIKYFATIVLAFATTYLSAQSFAAFFKDVQKNEKLTLGEPQSKTFHARIISVNLSQLSNYLLSAPLEFSNISPNSPLLLQIPLPNGSNETFSVEESPMLETVLAAQYPEIKTYSGHGTSDKTAYLKISITPKGFHAFVQSANGTYFIDPFNTKHTEFGIVYDKKDFDLQGRAVDCKFNSANANNSIDYNSVNQSIQNSAIGNPTVQFGDCQRRNFRLALAATAEYTSFQGGTVALALAAQVVTINRVNGVYEKEVGAHLNLVANNNLIIYTNAGTDPYSNTNANSLLTQNQTTCDGVIGSSNYDIGHVFSTGGGGLAALGCVCSASSKAQAETGSSSPIGDAYDIDYVAHEMGHQFGGNHTFSASTGSCSGNGNQSTAVEVGSGITIMAYAGICSPNDIDAHSIDNFHSTSLGEITTFLLSASASCRTLQTVTNNSPVIQTSTANKTIPKSTPFMLTCSATDADGDVMTYDWEQYDNTTGTQPPVATNTGGPMFRPFNPNTNPTWYFPRLDSLAANAPLKWQVLPSVARSMNFRLTVRDNHPSNGCTTTATNIVTVDATSGPFVVTVPSNVGLTYAGGSSQTVTWNVAGTTAAPVSCSNVDIFLSTDGGLTFPTQLASAQPNDGVQVVTMPNTATTSARIMVKGNGNIFFDISNNNFTITAAAIPDYSISATPNTQTVCSGSNATYTVTSQSILSYSNSINLSTAGLPTGASASFSPNPITPGNSSTLTITGLTNLGTTTITIIGTSTVGTRTANADLTVLQSVGTFTLSAPANNATAISTQPNLTWTSSANAASYTLMIATNSAFTTGVQTISGIATNSYTFTAALLSSTHYYWKVRAVNTCGNGSFTSTRNFTTSNTFCYTFAASDLPITINPATAQSYTSILTIPANGTITDLNIVNLSGTHSYISDLSFSLQSPASTTVNLMTNICNNESDFNINFDDASTNLYTAIPCPPTDGLSYQPQSLLSTFNGETINGNWTLNVNDNFPLDGGTLDTWGINVCYTPICNIVPTLTTSIPVCPNVNSASIIATIAGGISPFTYSWTNTTQTNDTITGLSNNTYALTVTDAQGCTATTSATISNPPSPGTLTTTSPTNASTINSTNITFAWNASTNSTSYQIDISTTSNFSNIVNTANGITTLTYSAALPANATYYWRVRGMNVCANGTFSTTKNFIIPNISCNTFMSTDVNLSIGPNGGTITTSNLSIPASGTLVDLNVVGLKGTHTYINDLVFSLKSPANIIDTLMNQVCGGDADFNIGFDDASSHLYATIPCPPTDSLAYTSYRLLSTYNSSSVNGQWQLIISDVANGDGGTLASWGLNVCYISSCTMAASTSKTDASCPSSTNGTATANQTGGVGPFSYLWSNSQITQTITGLAPGNYSVTITDSQGCTASATVNISSGSNPTASITPNTGILTCTNPSINLVASGGGTYLWNNGTTNATRTITSSGTYSVVVTNATGCTATASAQITSNTTAPTASITPSSATITCANPTATLVASGGTSYLWSNGATTASITVTSAATYSVTVTGTNGCTASASAVVSSGSGTPSASITPSSATITCANPTATLVASGGTSYLWSNGATTASITVTSAATYSVTVTGTNGCTASASAVVSSGSGIPTASITPSSATLTCANPTATLVASGGTSYLWSNGATTASITVTSAATYTVTVTGTNGCTANASAVVSSGSGIPTASITPSSATITCANPTATLVASGGTSYLWSNGATTASITVTSAATYSVTVTGTNGCTASASAVVSSGSGIPTASITPSSATITCANPTATLVASGGTSYLWSNGATTASITVTSAATYSVTVTGTNGCTASASAVVSSGSGIPTASITPSSATITCANPTATLVASGGTSYLWSNGATTASITVTSAATYSVTVTGTNGCTANASSQVTSDTTAPTATITPTSSTVNCTNPFATLVASGGASYLWSNGSTSANITITAAGNYIVTATGTNGCTDTASAIVTSDSGIPTASITPSSATLTCANPTATLVASGGTSYLWSNGATTASITVTSAATYTVTVTGTNGCTASASAVVSAGSGIPAASITPSSATITCANPTATLVASGGTSYLWSNGATTASITVTSAATYTVTVTGTNGCTANANALITSNITQPTALVTPTITSVTCSNPFATLVATGGTSYLWNNGATSVNITVTAAGTYTVIATGANGCTASASATVTSNTTPPTAVVSSNTTELTCNVGSINLIATGGVSYLWNNASTNASMIVSFAGSYSVTVTGSNGCTATANTTITSNYNQPDGSITSGATQLCMNNSTTLSVADAGVGATYNWTGPNLSATNTSSVTITPTTSGALNYACTVIGANGCSITQSITITVSSLLNWYQDLDGDGFGNSAIQQTNCTQPTGFVADSSDCNDTDVLVHSLPPAANITANGVTSFCNGSSVQLISSSPNSNLWSNGSSSQSITVTTAGSYTVTVSNICGNTTSQPILVHVFATPTPVISLTGNVLNVDSTIYSQYQWYYNSTLLLGSANPSVLVTNNGNYYVEVTDVNACTAISNTINYIGVDLKKMNGDSGVEIFPNPTSDVLNLRIHSDIPELIEVVLFDGLGNLVAHRQYNSNCFEKLSLEEYCSGIYYLKVASNSHSPTVHKVIKR